MNSPILVGILLIALPVAFNLAFAALSATFGYPDILRRPTDEVLARFREGGTRLVMLWWVFAMTAVLVAPLAVLLSIALVGGSGTIRTLAAAMGITAAVVQFLGLIRWPFLVPYLARVSAEPDLSPARREAVDVVFQSFNRYLGVAVGEHLGYLFTGAWTILVALAFWAPGLEWLTISGIVIGAMLVVGTLEFVGPFEKDGWKLAGWLVPIGYILWSLWLIVLGVLMLIPAVGASCCAS